MQTAFLVNGKVAKASLNVKCGDCIEIQFGSKSVKVEGAGCARNSKEKMRQRTLPIFIIRFAA